MSKLSSTLLICVPLWVFSPVGSIANPGSNARTGSRADADIVAWTPIGDPAEVQQSKGTDALPAVDLQWSLHTFLGGTGTDKGWGVAVDSNGNLYVIGQSSATWGAPILAFSGNKDVFVAKLNASGILQWHTFLGSTNLDSAGAIFVDANGNVYAAGSSLVTWGNPVNPHAGGLGDAFAAKLDGSGALQWNTFLGAAGIDTAKGIILDTGGNLWIAGSSDATWGSPMAAHSGGADGFVAQLNANGALQWNTFLGSSANDYSIGAAFDADGNYYVGGYGYATWGSPIRPFDDTLAQGDTFVLKLNGSGVRQWNTFLGGPQNDIGSSIAVDAGKNIYVTGSCNATWGSPVNPFPGGYADVFVVKLNSSGALQWNTFVGSTEFTRSYGIAADAKGSAYVAGYSDATWGSPLRAYTSGLDGFIAKLNGSGVLEWHAFLGAGGNDEAQAMAVEPDGTAYLTGYSNATWGSPIRPYAIWEDAFVTRVVEIPIWAPRHAVGDFDGDGADEAAVDFGATGAWMYDTGSWSQLTPSNPEGLLAADVDGDTVDEILGDLGAAGLWLWNAGSWNQVSGVNVEGMAAGDVDADGADEMVADFGAVGLWLYNGGTWTQMSGVNADYVSTANLDGSGGEEIIGDFGATGLWIWKTGAWTQLSGVDADYVAFGNTNGPAGQELIGDFGATGLWLWSAGSGWTQLSGINADYMITGDVDSSGDEEVVGDFAGTGLWLWDSGAWTQLSGVNTDFMIRANVDSDGPVEVAADFGSIGLWLLNGGAWAQISGANPDYLMAGDMDGDNQDEILADFGSLGLYLWNAGAWSQISASNPE